jgi:hypothetical protein
MAKKLSTMALRLVDDLMGDMPRNKKKRLGAAIGFLAGAIANEKYNSLSDSEKQTWNQERIMHHGDFGVIVEDYGRRKKNPLVEGLGSGLMDSDKQDEPFWIYSPFLVKKSKKKRSKRTGRR